MKHPKTFVKGFHDEEAVRNMPYRRLGETDMDMSLLSFGGAGVSGLYEDFQEKDAIEVITESIRKGINYIDTAPYYGDGRSETVIGKALKNIPRNSYYISTKVGRYAGKLDKQFDYTAEKIKSRFQTSLDLLGLDYVDIIILHDVEFANMNDLVNEAIPAVQELVASHKVRYIGMSTYPLDKLWDVINNVGVKLDLILTYSRDTLIDKSLHDYYPLFKSKNLGVINAAPTAMRMLTNDGPIQWHIAEKEVKELCAKAAEYCKENGVELGKLAIHHTLESPISETVLVGMNSLEVLESNLDLVVNKLTEKEKEVLQHIKDKIFILKKNLNWEGIELKLYGDALMKN